MPSLFEQAKRLNEAGYYFGPRDPNRNRAFGGAFMVCEDVNEGPSDDAGMGGFCIVGDDLYCLIQEVYNRLEDC